jgi:ABC-2 type transport system permease protein
VNAVLATVRSGMADAFARRASFWSQVGIMVANDVAWVAFWVIFFHRVHALRGWDQHRVLLLFAVLTTSAGFVLGFLSNSRRLPQLVGDGALDEVLSLPVSPLAHLLVRRIDTVNLGDIVFGVTLFTVTAHPTPTRVLVYVGGVTASVLLLTGFLVATGSLVFFTRSGQGAELGLHSILLLATYPADVFTGYTKALLYTAVPAAFVSAVPARLIDQFTVGRALGLVAAAAVVAALGWTAFTFGLRRYTSGSAWSRG